MVGGVEGYEAEPVITKDTPCRDNQSLELSTVSIVELLVSD
ncbi:MAG: hypothetical protein Q8R55_01505 [Candidatus Taylorbacteria bacterium]|nr:hypothetical protein [Candidatus Taylorbacteria bacterium]